MLNCYMFNIICFIKCFEILTNKWRTIVCYNFSCVENMILSFLKVLAVVIDFIMWTSIYLEWALTDMRNVCLMNGPAKSKCSQLNGWVGHNQGATGDEGHDSWQTMKVFIMVSISLSILNAKHVSNQSLLFICARMSFMSFL